MEVAAAKVMFPRSLTKHNLRYKTMLCNGDAKTHTALNDMEVYNSPIVKEDCINHVAKSMYTGIETLKKNSREHQTPSWGGGKLLTRCKRNFQAIMPLI